MRFNIFVSIIIYDNSAAGHCPITISAGFNGAFPNAQQKQTSKQTPTLNLKILFK